MYYYQRRQAQIFVSGPIPSLRKRIERTYKGSGKSGGKRPLSSTQGNKDSAMDNSQRPPHLFRKISHKLRMKINKTLLCHNKRSRLSKQSKGNLPAVSSTGHADIWTDWVLTPHVSLYLLCMDLLLLIQPTQNSKEELQSIALYSHQLISLQLCTSQRLCQAMPLVHET